MNGTVKRKGLRKMGTVVLIVVGLITVTMAGGFLFDMPGRREIADMAITDVDFKKFHDGTFTGAYVGEKSHMRDTQVEVIIADGAIADIKVVKGALDKNGQPAKLNGGKTVNDLYASVLKKQSLKVDVISGATLTSKTHLKALENALELAATN
jgi:uncharacterized protein with FMN-binding domain